MNKAFDVWVQAMLRHRIAVLVVTTLITGAFAWVISGLPLMTTIRDLLPDDSPELAAYDEARKRFGGDETVLVALEREDHFTTEGLARLAAVTEAYKEHPLVDQVTSLTDADWLRADEDGLRIDPFYEPEDPRDPALVKRQVLADPLISKNLVSADGRFALVLLRLIPSERDMLDREEVSDYLDAHEHHVPGGRAQLDQPQGGRRVVEVLKQRMMPRVREIAREAGFTDPQIHLTGFPAVLGLLLTESEYSIKILLPATGLVIGLILLVTLRRLVDVVLPIVCVLPAVVWAIGMGGLIFGRLTIMTSVAPIMVLVVGMSDVVHLVTQFRHELGRGLDRDEAIRVAFREVGSACVLTSVTTLIGFGSMLFLPLPHSRELGLFAALGVCTAFLLAFTLTPVLLSFTKPSPGPAQRPFLTRGLARLAAWIAPRTRGIIAVGALVTGGTLALVSTIEVENHLIQKFPSGHPIRVAIDKVTTALGGTSEVEVRIDTGRADGVKDPAVIRAMWQMQQELAGLEMVSRRVLWSICWCECTRSWRPSWPLRTRSPTVER